MHRAVPKSVQHVSLPKSHIQPQIFQKINVHQLTKPTQNITNIKFFHNIHPFPTFHSNKTQWRLVSISQIKTTRRGIKLPFQDEEQNDKQKKKEKKYTDSVLDRFGKKSETELPPEIPRLLYGFVGSLVIPMLFVIIGSLLILYVVNNNAMMNRAAKWWALFKNWVHQSTVQFLPLLGWWNKQPEHTKVYSILFAANVSIFGLWQLTSEKVQEFLFYNFMHSTLHKNPIGMLLSGLSHKTLMHFVFNMVALYSFCGTSSFELGNAQMIGIFTAGCLASSGLSHLFKLAIKDISPSLGASGGVFALVASTTYLNPDMPLSFIFLPMFHFTAKSLLPALVLFDVVGALLRVTGRRWLGLDHVAHLGGAAFGYFYTQWVLNNLSQSTRLEVERRRKRKEKEMQDLLHGGHHRSRPGRVKKDEDLI